MDIFMHLADSKNKSPISTDPETFFAPPKRSDSNDLRSDIEKITNNPFIDNLMVVANGLFAVLNEHRQILTINESFLRLMGIDDPGKVLGLRPGEYVNCIHACEMPHGCGTSRYCVTCGAVISIMAALKENSPYEDTCALTIEKDNQEIDLVFQVRACPLNFDGKRFVLLFLQDISVQQHRANLERTFFHDISNIMCGVIGKSEILSMKDQSLSQLHNSIERLSQEICIQRSLSSTFSGTYQPLYKEISAKSVMDEIEEIFSDNPLKNDRILEFKSSEHDIPVVTDKHLVSRILVNMITNALEATAIGGRVKAEIIPEGNAVTFSVWNEGKIPAEISLRIFQRNFSTKNAVGRGLGTYSMKFFGEKVLGGKVTFETSIEKGTTFRLTLICL
jgi:hypothetical protein